MGLIIPLTLQDTPTAPLSLPEQFSERTGWSAESRDCPVVHESNQG